MASPRATGQLHQWGWKKSKVMICLQAPRTGLFMGMILLFRDDKHRWEFPNFRVWEENTDFLLKAEKTEGLWPFGSGDIRRSEGQRGRGHAQRNSGLAWMPGPGFFGNQ